MPPLPKRRLAKARRGDRRQHLGLDPLNTTDCPSCGKPRLPHTACPYCGQYRGRQVVEVKAPTSST